MKQTIAPEIADQLMRNKVFQLDAADKTLKQYFFQEDPDPNFSEANAVDAAITIIIDKYGKHNKWTDLMLCDVAINLLENGTVSYIRQLHCDDDYIAFWNHVTASILQMLRFKRIDAKKHNDVVKKHSAYSLDEKNAFIHEDPKAIILEERVATYVLANGLASAVAKALPSGGPSAFGLYLILEDMVYNSALKKRDIVNDPELTERMFSVFRDIGLPESTVNVLVQNAEKRHQQKSLCLAKERAQFATWFEENRDRIL